MSIIIVVGSDQRVSKVSSQPLASMSLEGRTPDGFRAVKHDLLRNCDAGTVYVAGDPKVAEHLVFYCAGFPCDHSSFLPQARMLVDSGDSDGKFFVGVSCMPEYDRVGVLGKTPLKPEGYDLDEIAACFAQAVKAFQAEALAGNGDPELENPRKLTVVVHDWGVLPGFYYANTHGCSKLVVFDVLMGSSEYPPDRVYYIFCHLFYQIFFALSFFFFHYLGSAFGKLWLYGGQATVFTWFSRWLNPASPRDMWNSEQGGPGLSQRQLTPFLCYPYFYVFKALLGGKMDALAANWSLDKSLEKQPICYIYGEDKNTQFHTQAQLRKLRDTPGCEVLGLPNAGHWCYKHEPKLCFQAVRNFILRNGARNDASS